jgi:hypothetical protein
MRGLFLTIATILIMFTDNNIIFGILSVLFFILATRFKQTSN